MNFRDTLKIHKLEIMRRRARAQVCKCANCVARREGGTPMGQPLAVLLGRMGLQIEPDDETPPSGGKAH